MISIRFYTFKDDQFIMTVCVPDNCKLLTFTPLNDLYVFFNFMTIFMRLNHTLLNTESEYIIMKDLIFDNEKIVS